VRLGFPGRSLYFDLILLIAYEYELATAQIYNIIQLNTIVTNLFW
jgi:hypothetical protein